MVRGRRVATPRSVSLYTTPSMYVSRLAVVEPPAVV